MTSRPWWIVPLAAAQLVLGEWIRLPRPGLVWAAAGLLLVAAGLALRRARVGRLLALLAVAQAAVAMMSERQLSRVQHRWSEVREERITAAALRWEQDLKAARALVERLAEAAARAGELAQEGAFDALRRLVRREPVEVGVAILEADETPFAWAGRHRLPPLLDGDSIDFRATPYYATIASRRHLANMRTVVASALLAADSTVPDRARSLANRFEAATGVGLVILPPGVAPDSSDVFDYVEPTTAGPRLLFSVQLAPQSQAAAYLRLHQSGARRIIALAVPVWVLALIGAPAGLARFGLFLLPLVAALRVPQGDPLGLPALFSPRVFFHPGLGPASQAAAPLAMLGATGLVLGCYALWRCRVPHWGLAPIAAVLTLGAPFLVSTLGRGIQLPPEGVSTFLWITWNLTIFLITAALIVVAAALLPAPARPERVWPAAVGAGIGVTAAVVGMVIWNARHGWPDWYPLLWAGALWFVIWPGRRAATLLGLGVVAGSAAALMVWGAELEARVAASRADLLALGERADPIAVPLLNRFLDRAEVGAVPQSASELFALWRSTALRRQGFPAALALWGPGGELRAELRLDEVDLPDTLVSRVVRDLPVDQTRHLEALSRVPSVHYLALVRLDPRTVLSVGLGPRTALVPQARLGRLLEPAQGGRPPYRLILAPSYSLRPPDEGLAFYRRESWAARGERTVAMGDGARDVFAVVDLGAPQGLLVRGALLVVLNVLLLFGVTVLAEWLATGEVQRPRWLPERHAFRTRIAMALAAFFVVPAVGFATINVFEIARDGRSRRDLMIAQTLRDAAPAPTLPLVQGVRLDRAMEELAERVDANLVLFRDGRLIASSGSGVFEDFGVVPPLVDPDVYHRIQIDGELSAVTWGPSTVLPIRLGVRAVRLPTGEPAMLASPQSALDPAITTQQLDLVYLVGLAVLVGLAAALVGAQLSARALSRPAADLRDAALAFGRGEPMPPPRGEPPTEFVPVFAALERMAADVRRTQEAEAQAARVLAWGEMATQIAHEIKNPLTPMRLGIQHLRRVQRDGRAPIGPTLEETSRRILGEIDRLDTIARAFSRFAAPAEGRPEPGAVVLGEVVREVAALYRLAPGAPVAIEAVDEVPVLAHQDEVKEALLNLLENARNAGARRTVVRIRGPELAVEDDGEGIPPDRLPRIFEPRFSTTTSGSGLGLAIVKRLVEGWGATIAVDSLVGRGTTVTIRFRPAGAVEGGGTEGGD